MCNLHVVDMQVHVHVHVQCINCSAITSSVGDNAIDLMLQLYAKWSKIYLSYSVLYYWLIRSQKYSSEDLHGCISRWVTLLSYWRPWVSYLPPLVSTLDAGLSSLDGYPFWWEQESEEGGREKEREQVSVCACMDMCMYMYMNMHAMCVYP